MVAAPYYGDGFLSLDLTADEISATGSHRLFAQLPSGIWMESDFKFIIHNSQFIIMITVLP